jgi:hypothetical protein
MKTSLLTRRKVEFNCLLMILLRLRDTGLVHPNCVCWVSYMLKQTPVDMAVFVVVTHFMLMIVVLIPLTYSWSMTFGFLHTTFSLDNFIIARRVQIYFSKTFHFRVISNVFTSHRVMHSLRQDFVLQYYLEKFNHRSTRLILMEKSYLTSLSN